jgi:hypothetical protein
MLDTSPLLNMKFLSIFFQPVSGRERNSLLFLSSEGKVQALHVVVPDITGGGVALYHLAVMRASPGPLCGLLLQHGGPGDGIPY